MTDSQTRRKTGTSPWKLLMAAWRGFMRDNVLTHSASLSFYTLLSFAPLIVLSLWVSSAVGPGAQDVLLEEIEQIAGSGARETAQAVIEASEDKPRIGSIAGLLGILVTLVGATTVFAQLQTSLNKIWGIEVDRGNAVWAWLRRRILSIGVVAAIGFVVIVSLLASAIVGVFLSQTGTLWDLLNQVITAGIFAGLFMLLFRYLPDARLPWDQAIRGGIVTSILFTVGKALIGLYLAQGTVGSAYGAAGSVVLLMVWVYYSSAIFFFGAEFVQAWTNALGRVVPPASTGAKKPDHEPNI